MGTMMDLFAALGSMLSGAYMLLVSWPLPARLGLLAALLFASAFARQMSRSSRYEAMRLACALLAAACWLLTGVLVLAFMAEGWQALYALVPHTLPSLPLPVPGLAA